MSRSPDRYSELYGRAMEAQERDPPEYEYLTYICLLGGCKVTMDLPSLPRNEDIFKRCPECDKRTFMRMVTE